MEDLPGTDTERIERLEKAVAVIARTLPPEIAEILEEILAEGKTPAEPE